MTDEHPSAEAGTASGATVFVGDSLTEAGDWAAAFPDLVTVNQGVSGSTTGDVIDRLDDVYAVDPTTVLLMIGTNDLALRATVEQVVRGIENILFEVHRRLPDVRIVVQSILPREQDLAEYVHQANIHIRQFAPSVKAAFVDLWPVFADDTGQLRDEFSADRLHLNDAGYDAWAEALRPVLDSVRQDSSQTA